VLAAVFFSRIEAHNNNQQLDVAIHGCFIWQSPWWIYEVQMASTFAMEMYEISHGQ